MNSKEVEKIDKHLIKFTYVQDEVEKQLPDA